ncbi:MAG TPA: plastocyanin/azurin family copper-binding protein [Ktedonobacteraceae bacterium]
MKRMALLAVFAMMLAALVACGGSSTTTSAPTNYAVTMSGVTFNMNTISVPKGSTITFTTTQGGAAHNLVIGSSGRSHPESGTPDFGTGGHTVGSGQSWTSPPWNTAGTFHVTCTYHPTTMTLTVTVTG